MSELGSSLMSSSRLGGFNNSGYSTSDGTDQVKITQLFNFYAVTVKLYSQKFVAV